MKKIRHSISRASILFLIFVALISCRRDPPTYLLGKEFANALPFENGYMKVELSSENIPSENIRMMQFTGELTGFVATYDGKIFKTTDGGKSWSMKYEDMLPDHQFKDILFVNDATGYAVGGVNGCSGTGCICQGAMVIKTIDGGDTWSIVYQLSGCTEFTSIALNNNGDLFLLRDGVRIYKSTNQGVTWSQIVSLDFEATKIIFNGSYGFCIGGDYGYGTATIMRSTDYGNTWNNKTLLPHLWNNEITFLGDTGYCVSDYSFVYKTTNNGDSWDSLSLQGGIKGVHHLDILAPHNLLIWGSHYANPKQECYGCEMNAEVNQSTDGGASWLKTAFEDFSSVNYLSFYSANEGYALASNKFLKITLK